MCGITGFTWDDKELIKKITSRINYRGPDADGYFTDKGISLGHRRLAIIDLSPKGNQPMFNEDNSIVIVFNGEIYNFKAIRKDLEKKGYKFSSNSDTEVIIKGYEEYGEEICTKLDGMFAFGLWDKKKGILLIARDRIGKKPLYYSIIKNNLIFASEIKAILEAGVSNNIDKKVLLETAMCRFSPGNDTAFLEIKKLPPGSYGIFLKGKLKISYFWQIPELTETKQQGVKEVDNLIESAVEKRLISDVPIGILLSGGLDSSTIVSYMKRKTDKIKTFSVGFTEGMDESKYARIVSEHFNTEHKEIILEKDILSSLPKVVYHLDEPISDPAALPTYLLCKEVSKHVKVALSGEGGDEVFGGYDTVTKLDFIKKINSIPWSVRSVILSPVLKTLSKFNQYPKRQIYNFGASLVESRDIEEAYKKLFYFPFNSNEIKDFTGESRQDTLDKYLQKDLYKTSINFYFKEWLPNDLLMKVDKTSMASSLEIRAPFLDKDLIEYSFSIPRAEKINKKIFRQVVSQHLPKEIVKRKKQGFSLPISTWFTNKDFISRVSLHIEDLSKRNLFKERVLNNLIHNPTKYRNDHKLWTLLNVELWHKLYIDKTKYEKIAI